MKKIIVIMLMLMFFFTGCTKDVSVPAEDQGRWVVVSINYPDVLAEKGERLASFRYIPPKGVILYGVALARSAKRVKPGWVIIVDSRGDYAFFPPSTGGKQR